MNIPVDNKIRIAGGGIAGLSTAIYLQSKNHPTIVYEKELKIGESRHGDFEGIAVSYTHLTLPTNREV